MQLFISRRRILILPCFIFRKVLPNSVPLPLLPVQLPYNLTLLSLKEASCHTRTCVTVRLSKKLLGGLEGRGPSSRIPNPATCAVGSEALRNKVFLTPPVTRRSPRRSSRTVQICRKSSPQASFFNTLKLSHKNMCDSFLGCAYECQIIQLDILKQ